MYQRLASTLVLTALIGAGCVVVNVDAPATIPPRAGVEKTIDLPDPLLRERDEIYTLLAYAVVLKDWQTAASDPKRGHNIGSVLVDPGGEVVFWARNCKAILGNGTQHGEVRLMLGYLDKVPADDLENHTVYTTLEPCSQCSGMMQLQKVARTVYGQTDPGFGSALQRLQLDTHKLPELLPDRYEEGYEPYPRQVAPHPSDSVIREKLDAAYDPERFPKITDWLLTEEARAVYREGLEMLLSFEVRYEENREVLAGALKFLETQVTDEFTPLDLGI